MKCPACEFIFFDGRDLCPKCMLDLRSYKKKLGLAVANPDTPYKDLIKQRLNSSSIQTNPPIKKEVITGKTEPEKTDSSVKSFLNGISNKIFDNKKAPPPTENHIEANTTESPIKLRDDKTEVAPNRRPETRIQQEDHMDFSELAKAIENLSSGKKKGPEIIDFSNEDEIDINSLLQSLESDLGNKG